jgi:AcrR family transcriptional regulator
MSQEQTAVKERILQAAIELIRDEQDFDRVSMRSVADKAGVAVSMVNYHYQTKSNLIDQAVQSFVGSVIRASSATAPQEHTHASAEPVERMRAHLRVAADFMARNPGISRVSILRDLESARAGDNSSQVASAAFSRLKEIFGEEKSEEELRFMTLVQVASMQQLFLRAELNREYLGLDYFDKGDRDQLIDMLIETLTGRRRIP